MKLLIKVSLISLIFFLVGCSKSSKENQIFNADYPEQFQVVVSNPLDSLRKDVTVQIDVNSIKEKYPDFNPLAFMVLNEGNELPSQAEDIKSDSGPERIDFLTNLNPGEKQNITIRYAKVGVKNRKYTKRTQAVLGKKVGYKLVKGEYTGGRFEDVDSVKVPADHVAHDALYRIEGPGWESDLITYRFYLDSRNRNDIFGKKVHELVLQKIGVNDLVSNSKESYTKMLDWGMDIFKVGESLGIGSIGMWYDNKVYTVSKTDSVMCIIAANGPVRSDVFTKYYGWQVGKEKYNLFSNLSISAGSRLTKVDLDLSGSEANFCTGLAKHDNCVFMKSVNKNSEWGYIALYGKQSLSGDNLGISVFYKNPDLIKTTEDNDSYIVVLKPTNNKLQYYFAAAWEEEPDGIKNKDEFQSYLNKTVEDLNNPVEVSIK
jgi:hypothetical protein